MDGWYNTWMDRWMGVTWVGEWVDGWMGGDGCIDGFYTIERLQDTRRCMCWFVETGVIAVLDGWMCWSDAAGVIAVGGGSALVANNHNGFLRRRCSKGVSYTCIDDVTSSSVFFWFFVLVCRASRDRVRTVNNGCRGFPLKACFTFFPLRCCRFVLVPFYAVKLCRPVWWRQTATPVRESFP